jgi:two-component system sensor histidine kinase ResE
MGALLDDLIHVTVLDSGALELKSESLDVATVIEEAVMGCEAQFRERGVELILDIAPEPPHLNADRDALRQIFTHLLNNAAAVSPSDSEVTLTVRREVEPGNRIGEKANYLFISVSDAGGGIAPEDQPRVFSRLYRADSPLVAGLGDTGVGLSMVKALVEAHGGRVWVESELKKGSVFHVLMPLDSESKNGNNGSLPSP